MFYSVKRWVLIKCINYYYFIGIFPKSFKDVVMEER